MADVRPSENPTPGIDRPPAFTPVEVTHDDAEAGKKRTELNADTQKELAETAGHVENRVNAREMTAADLNLLKETAGEGRKNIDGPSDVGTPKKHETFLSQTGDVAEALTEKVLPAKWTEHMSRERKILIGGTMTLGIGVLGYMALKRLFGRGKKSIEEGEKAAEKTKGGFLKKLLIGTAIGVGAFFGLKYLFKKFGATIDEKVGDAVNGVRNSLPKIPSLPNIREDLKKMGGVAGAVGGTAFGAGERVLERGGEQLAIGAETVQAIAEFIRDGDESKLLASGWMLLQHEGKWVFDNGYQTFAAPATFIQKYLSGDIPNAWEGGWLYGEAGASYVIGRATWRAVLTGKIPFPRSYADLGKTAMRMGAWPGVMAYDGRTMLYMIRDGDGRLIAENILKRWGPFGMITDARNMSKATGESAEALGGALKYFQHQRELLAAMERQSGGLLKGLITPEKMTHLKNTSELLAKELGAGGAKLKAALESTGQAAPEWIRKLAEVGDMRDASNIVKKVDEAGALLRSIEKAEAAAKNAAGVASTVAKNAEPAAEVARELNTVDKVQDAIAAAREAGDVDEAIKLLESPVLKTAAEQGDDAARALLKTRTLLTVGKWAGRAALVAGPVIDAVLFTLNERALTQAKEENNEGLVQTLESKRTHLAGMGATGLGMFALSGPQALAIAPFYLGASLYANAVYDSVIDWEKSSNDWLKLSPDALMEKLRGIPVGHVNRGHRAAYGDSVFSYVWKRLPLVGRTREELDREGTDDAAAVEAVNANQRREILTAYFIRTMQVARAAGESDAAFTERIGSQVRDRMNFIGKMTEGTYAPGVLNPETLVRGAESYATLMAVRRERLKTGESMNVRIAGTNETLDLNALRYIYDPAARNEQNVDLQTQAFAALKKYETYMQPTGDAVADALRLVNDTSA